MVKGDIAGAKPMNVEFFYIVVNLLRSHIKGLFQLFILAVNQIIIPSSFLPQ